VTGAAAVTWARADAADKKKEETKRTAHAARTTAFTRNLNLIKILAAAAQDRKFSRYTISG
jgi:hypothetical protein